MIDPIKPSHESSRRADLYRNRLGPVQGKSISERLTIELKRAELSIAVGLRDEPLIDRLIHAGFDAETVPALSVAPLALVAWGSGEVTNRELSAAVDSLFYSSLPGKNAAIRRFRHWLKTRPSRELWDLWKAYTAAQLNTTPPRQVREDGEALFKHAERIALASGGLFGMGQICSGEKRVLRLIRDAYGLDSVD